MNEEKRGADTVTLKIPRPLYENLQTIIQGTGFRSVTEFAIYVLRDLASTGRAALPDSPASSPEAAPNDRLTPGEVDLIRRRLRALGYL